MKNGLKERLFQEIKAAYPKVFYMEAVQVLADDLGYRRSNAERRLRELCQGEKPSVEAIRNVKGVIIGYRYNKFPEAIRPVQPPRQDQLFQLRNIYNG